MSASWKLWKRRTNEMTKHTPKARCVVIAGPNGAGKTTLARRYLPEHGVIHFVNADLIASGLSPFRPELAAVASARMLLRELDRLAANRTDFAFETTLSGSSYVRRLQTWKQAGYRVEMVYLRLDTPRLALRRIASRVCQGGHSVPRVDVVRRFSRSWGNFQNVYRGLADTWALYDNSGEKPQLLDEDLMKTKGRANAARLKVFADGVGTALRRAANDARKIARMYGTPIYVLKNGNVVAEKP